MGDDAVAFASECVSTRSLRRAAVLPPASSSSLIRVCAPRGFAMYKNPGVASRDNVTERARAISTGKSATVTFHILQSSAEP